MTGTRATWTLVDGERVVEFGRGRATTTALDLLERRDFAGYALLTTERAAASLPALAERARVVAIAGRGLVVDVAEAARDAVAGRPLVALGGGRVIDAAKAIGARERALRPEGVAAIPTTLSGAELTPNHRLLPDTVGGPIRPSLVVCDPALMASQPMPALAASAMNALAHACEPLWLTTGGPITDTVCASGARLLLEGLGAEEPDRDALALGAVHAAYGLGITGAGVHHLVCQTIVQRLAVPHAATNAIVLPHVFDLMARLAPAALAPLGADASLRVRGAGARAGATRLRELGHTLEAYLELVPAMLARPELARTPGVGEVDLVATVEAAW